MDTDLFVEAAGNVIRRNGSRGSSNGFENEATPAQDDRIGIGDTSIEDRHPVGRYITSYRSIEGESCGWVRMFVHVCMYPCMNTYSVHNTYMHTYVCTCMYVCERASMHVCMYVCMRLQIMVCMYICMHAIIYEL